MIRKILIATMSLGIGGAETHIVELALELQRRGVEVLVASNGGVYVAELEKASIRHFTVPMDKRSVSCMLKSYLLMRKIIKKEKPDIVHAHARIPAFICGILHKTLRISRKHDTNPGAKVTKSRKMKFSFVTTAHGVFQLGGGLKHFTDWGEKTIAVSEDIKDYLIGNYGINADDVFLTINSIDSEKFSPETDGSGIRAELNIPDNAPLVLTIARLEDDYSRVGETALCLIEAAPALSEKIPNLRIIITGKAVTSDGSFEKQLNSKAKEFNDAAGYEAVIMTGQRTDVNKLLAACDLFVGVSRAALEAMSTAKPVILAGGEGYLGLFTPDRLRSAVETNFCCRGYDEVSAEKLQNDIIAFFNMSESEVQPLRSFARELIINDYSPVKMADDCFAAYRAAYRPKYNVVMSGYYGFKNIGDEAILQAINSNINEITYDVSITVLSSDPTDTKERYGYSSVNSFNPIKALRAISKCDALISGGGSLLQDVTSTRSLLYYLFIIRMATLMNKKVMLYANGIGPVKKESNRRRVKRVLSRIDVITLRDSASLDELRLMGINRDDMRITADPVFTMDGIDREKAQLIAGIPSKPFIAVSIRDWSDMGGFCEEIAAVCDEIYEELGREIIFISMQANRDVGISKRVQGIMKSPSHIIEDRLSAEEMIGVIGLADAMIAMRLHALIFAARMNIPFASIMYDPKVTAYTNALEMPSAGDVAHFDSKTATKVVFELLNNRRKYSDILNIKSLELYTAAKEDPKLLLELLRS